MPGSFGGRGSPASGQPKKSKYGQSQPDPEPGSQRQEWQQEITAAMEDMPPEDIEWGTQEVAVNQIVEGRVLRVEGDFVLVDVGYKSEGIILRSEWEEGEALPKPGQIDQGAHRGRRRHPRPGRRLPRHDHPQQAQGREDRGLAEGDGDRPRERRGHRRRHAQDQGRPAGRYRRERVPAGQPGRYPPPGRHRRLHRPHHPVHRAEDRRGAAQHRRQPPGADRGRSGPRRRPNCWPSSKSASAARAWSRTSPSSARSSTWAASTACCTSPT